MLNVLLSAEKLNDIQICPTLYNYKHELLKVPIRKPDYFEEGELMHEILRIYYSSKMTGEQLTFDQMLDSGRNFAAKGNLTSESVEETIKDARMYLEFYKYSDSWEILGVEEPFAKELYSDEELRIVLIGKSDLIVKTNRGSGPIAVVDHKYESRFYEKLERDNQPLSYCWAFEARDFIYNRIGKQKTKKTEEKLLRPYFSFSEFQINDWKNSVIEIAHDLLRYYTKDVWPMRFHGCTIHGRRCTFYDVCNSTPDNRIYKLESLFRDKGKFSVMGDE